MNDFFQHFDSPSSHFHHADQNHFGFNFDTFFDDEDELDYFSEEENHIDFGDVFGGFDSDNIYLHTSDSSRQNCRTVTRRQGNTVSTMTECF